VPRIKSALADLGAGLVDAAEPHTVTVMPGFTHLQPAQPITAAHWLMAHFWPLTRDSARFGEVLAHTRAFCPLGAGALAGNAFPIDRHFLAAELGFDAPAPNSLDAVSDRDPIAEFLFAAALAGVHLSRLAEDVIVYAAWGLVKLADEWTTGSSIMPQKRNPDALELARGKAGRLIGRLSGLLTTLKGLPTAYNKDLQEDKEPLFDAADTLFALLPVLAEVIATLTLHPDAMRAALDVRMLATDLADALVRAGMPFRAAHHVISDLVDEAARRGVRLDELPDAIFLDVGFGADFREILDFDRSVARRDVFGGTAPDAVKAQLEEARAWLNKV
jgi:argininosuccinate lyase